MARSRITTADLEDAVEAVTKDTDRKLAEAKRKLSPTEAQKHEDNIINALGELGGARARDTTVSFGRGFQLPVEYQDNLEGAVEYLASYVESQEAQTEYSRTFMRRPWDGAVCMVNAMQKNFGTTGKQRGINTIFFRQPPELRTIPTGPHGETTQVPWGLMEFPLFRGTLNCGSQNHKTYGQLFHLTVRAAKKHASQVEGFFKLVEEECEKHSIYQGKAIDGQDTPEFIDPYVIDPEKIVFSAEITTQLQAKLWSSLENSDLYRELGLPLNRKVLLTGGYGTGKTITSARTMQVGVEHNWTNMTCRPGRDDLDKVMQTARLYQPCVVIIEDIENAASTGDSDEASRLLDLFDGVQAKGVDVVGVLTTNHINDIHQAMLRPGRLDAIIELGNLDRDGIARMIEVLIKSEMRGDIDYDKVFESMKDYPPAFVKEAIEQSVRYAIDRTQGKPDAITTDDLIEAAVGLRTQFDHMQRAKQGKVPDKLGQVVEAHVRRVLTDDVALAGEGVPQDDGTYITPFVSTND